MIFLAYHVHNNNYYASGKPKKSIIIIIITDIINIQKIHDFNILQGKHGIVLCALE